MGGGLRTWSGVMGTRCWVMGRAFFRRFAGGFLEGRK